MRLFFALCVLLVPLSVLADAVDDDEPEAGDCGNIPSLNSDCTLGTGVVTSANVDGSIATIAALPTITFTTSTTVSTVTACAIAGSRIIETDAVANNDCVCTDAAADTWLCADTN